MGIAHITRANERKCSIQLIRRWLHLWFLEFENENWDIMGRLKRKSEFYW
jgi:hypothetical protein